MGGLQNVWEVVHASGPFPSSTLRNWKCNCIDIVTKCQNIPEIIGLNTSCKLWLAWCIYSWWCTVPNNWNTSILGIPVGWNVCCGTVFCLNSLVGGKYLKSIWRVGGQSTAIFFFLLKSEWWLLYVLCRHRAASVFQHKLLNKVGLSRVGIQSQWGKLGLILCLGIK